MPEVVHVDESRVPRGRMIFWAVQLLNGLSFGMLLFLLAAGLSMIYGLMRMAILLKGTG